jgi:uncharacterized protein (TIGR03435 family)
MFDRFTERARRVLFFAREEALQLGSIQIEPEHLLLGLTRESDDVTDLLTDAGVTPNRVRDDVRGRVPRASERSSNQEIAFSEAAKRVLQRTADEADRPKHRAIGGEHLLLALLGEQGSIAADVLTSCGLYLDRARQLVADQPIERRQYPGPPSTPANTFKWPWLPFVPSPTVHVLYSELKPPQQPITNFSGSGMQAYGYTLTEAVVHAWHGNPWHIYIADGLDDGRRYDFYIQFAQATPTPILQRMWREAIERQFNLSVAQETRPRDVWVARRTGDGGSILRYEGEPLPRSGIGLTRFNLAMERPHDAPFFPLEPFAVHSVPFAYLTYWFEDFLGGDVIDDTGVRGLYGFELPRTVASRDDFIRLLRDEAGVSVTREQRDVPTLVVRRAVTRAVDV